MRCSELAAGALDDLLHALANVGQAFLLFSPSIVALDEAARGRLLEEFTRARRHISFTLQVKTSFYKHLPWVLLGCAHHSRAKAQLCAARALQLYAHAGAAVQSHWLVKTMCTGEVLNQLILFRDGQLLQSLPKLELLVAKMKFCLAVERWIEARHALSKRIFNHSPAATALHLAFHTVLPVVQRRLVDDAANALLDLGPSCQSTRTSLMALRMFGLYHHPVVQDLTHQQALADRDLNRAGRGMVVQVFFHVDGRTLMQPLPQFGSTPPAPPPLPPSSSTLPGPPAVQASASSPPAAASSVASAQVSSAAASMPSSSTALAPAAPDQGAGPVALTSSSKTFHTLFAKYATSFLKDCIFGAEDCEETVVSVGPHLSDGTSLFDSVRSVVDPQPKQDLSVQFEVVPEPMPQNASQNCAPLVERNDKWDQIWFFTMARANVGSMVVPFMAPRVSTSGVFAVYRLPLLEVRNPQVRVGLEGVDGRGGDDAYCFSTSMLTLSDLETLKVWRRSAVHYSFAYDVCPDKLKEVEQELLLKILEARKAPGGQLLLHTAGGENMLMVEAADRLRTLDLMHCIRRPSDATMTCNLTSVGEQQVVASVWLELTPQRLAPRAGVALQDMTHFELLSRLQTEGWTFEIASRRFGVKAFVHDGTARNVYVRGNAQVISDAYMLALLTFADHKQPVRAFGTEADHLLSIICC